MSYFYRALTVSVSLHVLVLVAYVALSTYEPALILKPTSIQVSLTKLGQTRDPKLLPRLDVSEAPQKKKPKNPLDLLKKRFGKPTPEGQKKGSNLGSSLAQELANSYELQVLELLRNNYEIPRVISPKEAQKLKLWVKLRIDPQGKLIDIQILQASQNTRFDQAVLLGSRKITSFGMPPLQLARKYRTEGLLIQFCPLECL